ncbi:EamA family transporter RarD [Pasteurellaceae bacterium 20609_3]|uniref:EamA family transporter RarD n=1 Tax=Spirabiliibacterium mucosae TaxID=28156 RepID=UPI001AAD5C9B|nr:EamA family transporter RarD [Spirabiliibacterium mucosae]MBE2899101.1 EamA family transporter RarD [Spirabiliibacterium mucosae]
MTENQKGIIAALMSNVLFGALYLYGYAMAPLSGTETFAWRMVSMAGSLWLFLLATRGWYQLFRFAYGVGKAWKTWALILLPTPIIASQFWLFMWAPVNGYGVDVAMGYFLFPIAMVLSGRLFLNENVTRLQWLGVLLAALGVGHELWQTHAFSWVTMWIFFTYPIYYILRRKMDVPTLIGLLIDLTLILPFAVIYLLHQPVGFSVLAGLSKYWLLIPLLGLMSAAAMQLNLFASCALPVTLFGMFSYLEPTLLFILAVTVLGTPLTLQSLITYGLIWAGLALTIVDGWLKVKRART